MVAVATHSLCDAANAMVQGHASEEKLISSAKQVASSTAQLLVACKVKADQDSTAMRRLQVRGHSVVCKTTSVNMIVGAETGMVCFDWMLFTDKYGRANQLWLLYFRMKIGK